jgi:hypothetical protein
VYKQFDFTMHKDAAAVAKLELATSMVPVEHFQAWFEHCGYTKLH